MGFSGYASDLKYFFWQLTQSFFCFNRRVGLAAH